MTTSLVRSKGSQSSTQIGTFSFWMKVCSQGNNLVMYSNTVESDNNRGYIQLTTDGKWRMVDNDASGDHIVLRTNRVFRDFNAWYHFVIRVDTTQSTNTDRVRLYINGVQETSFDQTTYPAQNENLKIFEGGQTNREYINRVYGGSAYADNFILSHYHFTDGQSYGPDTFGSTDSTTGEWKINVNPTVTYGNQGFFLFQDDASLNDDSGNSNNWSADSGTVQKTEDCPSNVFATFNTLIKNHGATFSDGNTTYQSPSSNPVFGSLSTLGMTSGKFYAECKYSAGSNHYLILGIADENFDANGSTPDDLGKSGTTESIGYVVNTGAYRVNNSNTSWGSAGGDGDIIQIAVDCDNNKVFFGVNGVWGASSNPETGSNGIDVSSILTGDIWFFGVSNDTGSNETVAQFNFGNGYFGTTAITSEGTNASGNGKFEYDVPNGYTALSTKGLNL